MKNFFCKIIFKILNDKINNASRIVFSKTKIVNFQLYISSTMD